MFDVIVQGAPETRRSIEDIRNLLIDRPGGGHVRLGQVADVRIADAAASIQREAVSRRLDLVTEVNGRSVADVAADLQTALSKVDFPMEYHAEVLQGSTAEEVGSARVIGVAIGAGIAAFLLFQAAFRSWRLAVLAFACLPLSLAGGFVMVLFADAELSLGAILGLLAVVGLAARFNVLLVSTAQAIAGSQGDQDLGFVIQQAARQRLRPIVASSAALAVFFLPTVILGGRPGLEILHPLALVLLGGLATTAVVTLFVMPALYGAFASPRPVAPATSPGRSVAAQPVRVGSDDADVSR